jgi:two-component system sensor histidine kinase YesM
MKQSLRFKIIVAVLLLTTLFAGLVVYILQYGISIIRSQAVETHQQILHNHIEKIDDSMEDASQFMYNIIAYNRDLLSISSYAYGSPAYVLSKIRILEQLSSNSNLYEKVSGFFVYIDEFDDLLTTGDLSNFKTRKPYLKELLASNPDQSWKVYHTDEESGFVQLLHVKDDVYLGAWMNPSAFTSNNEPNRSLLIADNGEVLIPYKEDHSLLGSIHKDIMNETFTGSASSLKDNNDYLWIGQDAQMAPFYLLTLLPEDELLHSLVIFERLTKYVPVFVGAILLFLYLFMQHQFMKPLHELMKGLRAVSMGELSIQLKYTSRPSTEFEVVAQLFNQMVRRTEELTIHVYEEKLRTQQAEYKHLQLQINPHFYTNTLNIIYNMAALQEYKPLQKLTMHLSKYFRFSLQTNRSLIHLREELEHVHNYLEIQKLRYTEDFHYDIQANDETIHYLLPPLTVLTFVENSMLHGFKKRSKEGFLIRIHAFVHDDSAILIRITDNGEGFRQEQLRALNDGLFQIEESGSGIGIWNVAKRLQMASGSAVQRIRFNNADNGGAAVEILLPKLDSLTANGGKTDV